MGIKIRRVTKYQEDPNVLRVDSKNEETPWTVPDPETGEDVRLKIPVGLYRDLRQMLRAANRAWRKYQVLLMVNDKGNMVLVNPTGEEIGSAPEK